MLIWEGWIDWKRLRVIRLHRSAKSVAAWHPCPLKRHAAGRQQHRSRLITQSVARHGSWAHVEKIILATWYFVKYATCGWDHISGKTIRSERGIRDRDPEKHNKMQSTRMHSKHISRHCILGGCWRLVCETGEPLHQWAELLVLVVIVIVRAFPGPWMHGFLQCVSVSRRLEAVAFWLGRVEGETGACDFKGDDVPIDRLYRFTWGKYFALGVKLMLMQFL